MAAVKHHLTKRVFEAARISSKLRGGGLYYWMNKERKVSLRLPLASWNDSLPREKISAVLEMKPDDCIEDVSYSKEEDTLIFNIQEQMFIKQTMSTCQRDSQVAPTKSRNLVIEFSSPNIAKPFHMGHLRSTIVGQFISNLLSVGNDVTRLNYLGDWGTQFGFVQKGIDKLKVTQDDLRANPMSVLYKAYVESYSAPNMIEEARELFSKLENEDSKYLNDWETIKTITFEDLRKTYELLGIHFNEYCCESDYRMSRIQGVINSLVDKNVAHFQNDQLVTIIDGKAVPLLRQNGTTLYITRDIAAALDRIEKYKCENIVYVVDKSQAGHFKQLAGVLDKLGYEGVVKLLPFGRITGMSTRKGTSIFLTDILEESTSKMAEQQTKSKNTRATDENTTRILGLTGLQMYILKHGRLRDFVFNWEHALQGTGDSGVKVQYTHSRLYSLEDSFNFKESSVGDIASLSSLEDPSVLPLVFAMARCDDIIREATETMESSLIVAHLFKLCNLASRALKNVRVKGEEAVIAQHRLLLFHKARLKINELMKTLGLQPLNNM